MTGHDISVGGSFSREVVSESPEASRDRHLDRQRPLAKSFESRERLWRSKCRSPEASGEVV